MQERQVTIAGQTYPLPAPFLVLATQNPIESEGTYPLPEAQVDRFLMKIIVGYPSVGEEAAVVGRAIAPPDPVQQRLEAADLIGYRDQAREVYVDRAVVAYAVSLADATRHPERYGLEDLREHIAFGASPRGPIGMVQSAQALALLRGRRHVVPDDIRHLAPDVLRHRIALSYDALAEGVTAEDIVMRVLEAVDAPQRTSVLHDSADAA
jgi:MoxR-like ATPase